MEGRDDMHHRGEHMSPEQVLMPLVLIVMQEVVVTNLGPDIQLVCV